MDGAGTFFARCLRDVQNHILTRNRERGRGSVFIAKDFLDLGSRDADEPALSRLARVGAIQRLGRGLYLYPGESGAALAAVPADPDEIADASGRQTGSQVVRPERRRPIGLG
ncbi:MAG: DUF6088 family protein [Isosphaeraceae bacterium]